MSMSPALCRAARGLVNMTQQQLAEASGVGLRTITRFEKGEGAPIPANLAQLRRALEESGVDFTPPIDGKGPGVRLARPPGAED